ncbi:formate dehydrogenase subunit gamma [Notoacmeibacter sp. MSK16QG-6]|uniref:formate dehydrogenase subunit gamma n=1 Tax=Notoacmeibacter sp. MSK16QG-6 TaxID=2957982 RepID=UPI0020A08C63|nr:formate dehydrogenase subunit gamma [Notoacmeibacter sp. MSK16QG-6]MCP1199029.1 formate dehydrogenase subunit gamma [Notoacmeibacter sp. MSK16QG-6]
MQTGEAIASRIQAIIEEHADMEGPLLPLLHAVQAEFGFVPDDAIRPIAEMLNISRAEVHGVISFYHDFHTEPQGRHVLKICRAEACQARGGQAIEDQVRRLLQLNWNETSPDGAVTLEPVYCLGLCACGPNALIDDRPVAQLTGKKVESIVRELI